MLWNGIRELQYIDYVCKLSELNGDSKLNNVQLEKGIAQNLTCFKGSQNTRIKWFKVNVSI
jgi:hypothetical protein